MKYLVLICGVLVAGCSGKGAGPASSIAARAWPTQWCQAQPGMRRDQLVGVMGPPTSASAKQMTWSDDHYRFYAFLEQDGSTRQLDINLADLTPAEKAGLQCKDVRSKSSMAARGVAPRSNHHPACELVPAAAMSTILGSPVVTEASGNPAGGQSKCVYTSSGELGPYAELSVGRGDGESGMAGVGFAGKQLAGVVNPYDGIGDQAVSVGPALYIRTGDDLVTIVLSGVKDRPTAVRKIFDTAKAGM